MLAEEIDVLLKSIDFTLQTHYPNIPNIAWRIVVLELFLESQVS
jgi:hypothetical protein